MIISVHFGISMKNYKKMSGTMFNKTSTFYFLLFYFQFVSKRTYDNYEKRKANKDLSL